MTDLIQLQDGVLTRKQTQLLEIADADVRARVDSGEWQKLYWGVYATFPGEVPRESRLWGAVLRAGPGAALSHVTAAELHGLSPEVSGPIHVSVPRGRRVVGERNLRIHVSAYVELALDPAALPRRTGVEATVLDLVAESDRLGDALGWVTGACSRGLTSAKRLANELRTRSRLRWRPELESALTDVGEGTFSVLELGYRRRCERAHGLPDGVRQRRVSRDGRTHYRDVEYAGYGVIVELDGVIAHTDANRVRDRARDNLNTLDAAGTLRYGWQEVYDSPCAVAYQVATLLARRGWAGTGRACDSPSCRFLRA